MLGAGDAQARALVDVLLNGGLIFGAAQTFVECRHVHADFFGVRFQVIDSESRHGK